MIVRPDELLKSLVMPSAVSELAVEVHCRSTVRPEIVARMSDEALTAHDRRSVEVVNALPNTLEIPLELVYCRLPPALEEFLAILRANGYCSWEVTSPGVAGNHC